MEILIILLVNFIYFCLVYLVSRIKKKNSIVDIGWGFGFVIIAFVSMILSSFTLRSLIIMLLVSLWGIRLSTHLFKRNWSKEEDYRYKEMKDRWGDKEPIIAFFKIYMLQMLLMIIVALPIIINSTSDKSLSIINFIGIGIWLIGYFFEVVGDYQLREHLKQYRGKIMTTGLWKYTRHPNYFGESTMWFGIFIITIGVNNFIFGIISPLLITYLLIFVSGIPMLEKKYEENEDFQKYKKVTSALVPLPPRKED